MSGDLVPPTPTVSEASFNDDWDRSLVLEDAPPSAAPSASHAALSEPSKQQNSVAFPGAHDEHAKPSVEGSMRRNEKRTLSELLKLHAEKGTDVTFTQEEATRVGDELGQWINASCSPYEADDDFFGRSQDDTLVPSKVRPNHPETRTRGQSESLCRPS